jgi:hypothetical protein
VWDVFDSRAMPVTADTFPGKVGGHGSWSVRIAGFAAGEFRAGSRPVTYRVAVVPYWFLVLLFAAAPLRWAWVRHRVRFQPSGSCGRCGYDLRATPDRCPECGHAAG